MDWGDDARGLPGSLHLEVEWFDQLAFDQLARLPAGTCARLPAGTSAWKRAANLRAILLDAAWQAAANTGPVPESFVPDDGLSSEARLELAGFRRVASALNTARVSDGLIGAGPAIPIQRWVLFERPA